jgi:hypothetical protein
MCDRVRLTSEAYNTDMKVRAAASCRYAAPSHFKRRLKLDRRLKTTSGWELRDTATT